MKYSVNQVKAALGESQSTLNWQLQIVKAAPAGGSFDTDLQIRVQTAGMPTPEVTHNVVRLGGHEFNSRGKVVKRGSINLVFSEGTDARVTSYILGLMNAYWSADGSDTEGTATATTEDLKADIRLVLMDSQNQETQSVTLTGALFVPDTPTELGQESADLTKGVRVDFDDQHHKTPNINW